MKHLLPLLLLSGCAVPLAAPPVACPAGTPALVAQLMFGRSIKGGGTVSDADWRAFLATTITPRFPDGLTVLDAHGQWRDRTSGQVVREPAALVEIVAERSARSLARLEEIRAAYRARFAQDSVGLVLGDGCASF